MLCQAIGTMQEASLALRAAALQGWPSSPQEGQLLAAGGAQYLAPSSGNDAVARDSQVVHDFHAALGRSSDMAVAVAAIKVRRPMRQPGRMLWGALRSCLAALSAER